MHSQSRWGRSCFPHSQGQPEDTERSAAGQSLSVQQAAHLQVPAPRGKMPPAPTAPPVLILHVPLDTVGPRPPSRAQLLTSEGPSAWGCHCLARAPKLQGNEATITSKVSPQDVARPGHVRPCVLGGPAGGDHVHGSRWLQGAQAFGSGGNRRATATTRSQHAHAHAHTRALDVG